MKTARSTPGPIGNIPSGRCAPPCSNLHTASWQAALNRATGQPTATRRLKEVVIWHDLPAVPHLQRYADLPKDHDALLKLRKGLVAALPAHSAAFGDLLTALHGNWLGHRIGRAEFLAFAHDIGDMAADAADAGEFGENVYKLIMDDLGLQLRIMDEIGRPPERDRFDWTGRFGRGIPMSITSL